ncbi:MAG: hypothetical protein IH948_10800, partial [Bacteroidetes bacterium]|nr:hypothetical protein [Bacteroidota bacterium]
MIFVGFLSKVYKRFQPVCLMKRLVYSTLGFIFLLAGFSFILNSITGITGFVVVEETGKAANGVIGALLVFGGIFLLSKTRRKRKGQAAMEFLMTYGWAILAAIIVIGVLAIYFSPNTLTQTQVFLSAPFYGIGTSLATDQIQVEIRNNGGENIRPVNTGGLDARLTFNQPSGASCSTEDWGISGDLLP